MKSVIDIGTNTIRAVVYAGEREIFNKAVGSRLLDYTENGALSEQGIVWASNVVGTMSVMTEQLGSKPLAFATSAFRELKNAEETARYIEEYTGVKVRILTGKEEAECDWLSLKQKADFGVGVDLGGGSCQIISFDSESFDGRSYPIGVKRMKNRFVSGDMPTWEESNAIYACVKEETGLKTKTDRLYIFGGTARKIAGLNKNKVITMPELVKISKLHCEHGLDDDEISRLCKISVGATVFSAVADSVGAVCAEVVDCSVRNGFLQKFCD